MTMVLSSLQTRKKEIWIIITMVVVQARKEGKSRKSNTLRWIWHLLVHI